MSECRDTVESRSPEPPGAGTARPPGTFFFNCDMDQPSEIAFAEGTACVWLSKSPGKTTPNEDAAAVVPVGQAAGVLIVADGLGGQPGADQASNIAVRTLAGACLADRQPGENLRQGLLRGIEEANLQVTELGLGAGTTLAATAIEGRKVRPYHVGDSTILLTDSEGRIKWMSVPHSPIGYALEAGLLTEEEAIHHPDRHIISNMVGSLEMRIEIGPELKLEAGDTLLLSSDGVTDNLYTDELVEVIHAGSLARAGDALAEMCDARMRGSGEGQPSKPDDLTFLLYRGEVESS